MLTALVLGRRARRKDSSQSHSSYEEPPAPTSAPVDSTRDDGEVRHSKHRHRSRHRHHSRHRTASDPDRPSLEDTNQQSRDSYDDGPPPYEAVPPMPAVPVMPVSNLAYRPAPVHANTMPTPMPVAAQAPLSILQFDPMQPQNYSPQTYPPQNHPPQNYLPQAYPAQTYTPLPVAATSQPALYMAPIQHAATAPISSSSERPSSRRNRSAATMVTNGLWSASRSIYDLGVGYVLPQVAEPGSAVFDYARRGLDDVITAIDGQVFGNGTAAVNPFQQSYAPASVLANNVPQSTPDAINKGVVAGGLGGAVMSQFSKVWAYSNSRLPPCLPPCKLYISTYPLLCLAAQYSLGAYAKPTDKEKEDHVGASLLGGTKPMILKSLPRDDMNIVVFAIRGSASFTDWAVNLRHTPTSPKGFLDDEENLCHAGFLSVAKAMAASVTERLKTLLQEDPSRSTASLLITGHSAGGAVAQLLYSHMLSEIVDSELTHLAHFFKRVHCITFGAPPVSIMSLQTPNSKRNKSSVFLSFANEGDPVVRADKAVIYGLIRLLASSAPTPVAATRSVAEETQKTPVEAPAEQSSFWTRPATLFKTVTEPILGSSAPVSTTTATAPVYPIPPATLALGGRLVLLRPKANATDATDVEACQIDNEMLQEVVFGDPVVHMMDLYAQRIELLATRALTAGGIAA